MPTTKRPPLSQTVRRSSADATVQISPEGSVHQRRWLFFSSDFHDVEKSSALRNPKLSIQDTCNCVHTSGRWRLARCLLGLETSVVTTQRLGLAEHRR